MPSNLTTAVRAALHVAPASLTTLARAAGVSVSTLRRLRRGEQGASPAVARALARVLARWGSRCTRAGRRLRAVGGRERRK